MVRKPKPESNNLLLLSSLALILTSTVSLSFYKLQKPALAQYVVNKEPRMDTPIAPLPVLAAQTDSDTPTLTAVSVLALDVDSGVTLFEKNPDEVLFPASTTKIVTALVALDSYQLNEVVTIPALSVPGQKMGLVEGEQITVNNLLKGLLIFSANDAAEALAWNYLGGRVAFIDAMNGKASEFNLTNTNFTNPSGLENMNHVSTARDLSRIAGKAMNNPIFSEIVGTKSVTITSVDGEKVHRLNNINKLIGVVDGVMGVKTGYTEHAKENLITYMERNGKRVIISLLGSDDRFGETTALIDWIYGSYDWEEVVLP